MHVFFFGWISYYAIKGAKLGYCITIPVEAASCMLMRPKVILFTITLESIMSFSLSDDIPQEAMYTKPVKQTGQCWYSSSELKMVPISIIRR